MRDWRTRPQNVLFAELGLTGPDERPLATDGWSGAVFSRIERDGHELVLKRTSAARDWIVRATLDDRLRDAWLADQLHPARPWLGPEAGRLGSASLGAAADPAGGAVIVMPDLTRELAAWQRGPEGTVLTSEATERWIAAIAELHALPWSEILEAEAKPTGDPPPWCPLPERLTLLTPRSADAYAAAGERVGAIFLRGWDAFERHASRAARDLVARLAADPAPLVDALARLPAVGLHGDLKLANAARLADDRVAFIDWQMTLRAPIAVELGWFLVTNSAELPAPPDAILAGYRDALANAAGRWWFGARQHDAADLVGDWAAQTDLAWIVGLLLRGWRKGMDADSGAILGSGIPAAQDLTWWCDHALAAAARRL